MCVCVCVYECVCVRESVCVCVVCICVLCVNKCISVKTPQHNEILISVKYN